jgi:hypothetical protein
MPRFYGARFDLRRLRKPGRVRRLGFVALWWVALFWLWEFYAAELNRQTLVAAALLASVGAAVAERLRTLGLLHYRLPLRWVRRSATVPLQIVIDFGIVTAALFRRSPGEFVRKPFPAGGVDLESHGRRAWVTFVGGFSPNAYIVDIDPDSGEVLLHDLVRHEASERPA